MGRKLKKFLSNTFGSINAQGQEVLDPTPVAIPVKRKHYSQADRLRDLIRSEALARDLAKAGVETFDEADDFEIEDDPVDPQTPYEEVFDGDVLQDAYSLAAARKPKRVEAAGEAVNAKGTNLEALANALAALVKKSKSDDK